MTWIGAGAGAARPTKVCVGGAGSGAGLGEPGPSQPGNGVRAAGSLFERQFLGASSINMNGWFDFGTR